MDYLKKAGFAMGVVPPADVKAQKRCFDYLVELSKSLQEKIDSAPPPPPVEPGAPDGEDEISNLKRQKQLIDQIIGIEKAPEGSYGTHAAKSFWVYWDKIKVQAVRTEGNQVKGDVEDRIKELEMGRYAPT